MGCFSSIGVNGGTETSLQNFKQSCCAHTPTDAHRNYNISGATLLALDQCVSDHARTRHTIGVSEMPSRSWQ